jgi:hypothetical protein
MYSPALHQHITMETNLQENTISSVSCTMFLFTEFVLVNRHCIIVSDLCSFVIIQTTYYNFLKGICVSSNPPPCLLRNYNREFVLLQKSINQKLAMLVVLVPQKILRIKISILLMFKLKEIL